MILYTSRHHRQAQGRRADPRQPASATAETSVADFAEFGAGDVLLGALPLFHSFGQTCTMNGAVCSGATVTMLPRFDPEKALEIIERDRVTVFQGVPTMYNALLHAERADATDASTPAALHVRRRGDPGRADARLRGEVRLRDPRGLRPLGDLAGRLLQPPRQARARPGSIGTPIEGVEMQVWDDDGNEVRAGRGRRDRDPRPQRHEGLLGPPRGDRRRRSTPTAGSTPATWPRSTRTATSSSSTARRT